ncbi:MAG: hypothetical protein ACTHN4_06710 [Sphingomicrobium sp.]|jgi:hypothetical protein
MEAHDKGNKPEKYFYFVDGVKYESDVPEMSAADIKARLPNAEPNDKLSIDGHGDDPDVLLNDSDIVDLRKDKGPVRLTLVPGASFGA